MMTSETQIVLVLDLARDNPVQDSTLDSLIPHCDKRHVLRLSEFDAEPAARGSTARERRAWMIAINKMLDRARSLITGDAAAVHYYVVGRAFLPMWTYLGMSLSKWARVTCLNQRETGAWDTLPWAGEPESQRVGDYFNVISGLDSADKNDRGGKVAVFVSNRYDCSRDALTAFLRSQDSDLAGIVELRARPDNDSHLNPTKWLDSSNAAQASYELAQLMPAIRNAYPNNEGLALFVAGPAPLAMMAGRALNPHIFTPVWLPNHEGGVYRPAIEVPWGRGRTLKLFLSLANPRDNVRLQLGEELRQIKQALKSSDSRELELHVEYEARVDDVWKVMTEERPQVVHFSGHSSEHATELVDDQGYTHSVSAENFIELFRTTNDSFLELVIMNSCSSAEQARAFTEFVDCSIGMTTPIYDDAAVDFSKVFYTALAQGRTVKTAFDQARAVLVAKGLTADDVVKLYTRDGVNPDQVTLVEASRNSALR